MRRMLFVSALLGLLAGAARAQSPEGEVQLSGGKPPTSITIGKDSGLDPASAVRERYEEIEILGLLLDRGLARGAGVKQFGDWVGSVYYSPDGKLLTTEGGGGVRYWDVHTGKSLSGHTVAEVSGAQGYYLKGQGIVYALTMPLHTQKVVTGAEKPAPKEPTEWERIRKELRGEKVEAAKPRESGGTSIADAVLKVIADNGKNLTRLPDGESVTVAITLAAVPSGPGMMSGGGPGMMPPGGGGGAPGMGGGGPPGSGGPPHTGFPGGSKGPGPAAGGGTSEPEPDTSRAEFRKHALLGDLAMKQHDYDHAVQAFRQAAAVYKEPPHESDAQLELIEVGSKLARALKAQGKTAEAELVVKSLAKLSDQLAAGAAPAKPGDRKPEVPLPAKLIIKVPKALIDQWGLGKMTFDEFRKGASVEHLTFDKPAEKKP